MIKINPPIRNDKHGQGHYLASRGHREHNGIDYNCPAGSIVLSNCNGRVTKIGRPYYIENPREYKDKLKNSYRYVEITGLDGIARRFFYIKPNVKLSDTICTGDPIGTVMRMYLPDMKDHLHFECEKDGENIDPRPYV